MDPATVWRQFVGKLADGTFSQTDCRTIEGFCQPAWSLQPGRKAFRERLICAATPEWERGEDKLIFTLARGGDDEVRLDFIVEADRWFLYVIDGVTIRVSSVQTPFSAYPTVDHSLLRFLRAEREISWKLTIYRRLLQEQGKAAAACSLNDGPGLAINTAAWMPYFEHGKGFVVLVAWMETQMQGEDVVIEEFSRSRCVLLYRNHLWFEVYRMATHLAGWFTRDEYRSIYEDIWRGRAGQVGWAVDFAYDGHDTRVILTR